MLYTAEALRHDHDLRAFDCGKPELDMWLRASALDAAAKNTCKTFVWHDEGAVVAYYGLAAHIIEREQLSRSQGHGSPEQIPAVLIARLALDKTLHGQGFGSVLLADCLVRIAATAENVGMRFVVVDAIDDHAAAYYRAHGFSATPAPHRLVRKMSSVLADIASA